MSTPGNVEEVLGEARLIVRARVPYFRSALTALVPKVAEGLGTIGVSKRGVLFYDPQWLGQFSSEVVAGLLIHEIMHVLNKHGDRCGARDPRIFNMAGDCSINPSIVEMGFSLPDGDNHGVFPKDYEWPVGETAEMYYERFKQLAEEIIQQIAEKMAQDGHKCGSGGGNPFDHEPKCDGGHGGDEDGDGKTEAQLARVAASVAEAVKDHVRQKGRGSVPAGIERWAEEAIRPPTIPWRAMLQRHLRVAVAYREGAAVHRYDGPSRRQAGIGFGVGKPVLPRLRQPVPRVAVVVDTSGSMNEGQLTLALSEAAGVLKQTGASVQFLSCDAEVHVAREVGTVREMMRSLKGGGGSSFIPAFEHLERSSPRSEVVVLFTDGDIAVPKEPPSWAKVIWVSVGEGTHAPCRWGAHVHVEDGGSK